MIKVFSILIFLGLTSYAEDVAKKALFLDDKGNLQFGTYDPNRSHKRDKDSYAVKIEKYITPSNFSVGNVAIKKTAIIPEVEALATALYGESSHLKAGQIVLSKDQKPQLIEAVFENGKVLLKPLEINPVSRHRLKDINGSFAPVKNTNMVILDKTEIAAVLEQKCSKDGLYCQGQQITEINDIQICEKMVGCAIKKSASINGVFSNGALLINTTLFPPGTFSKPQDEEIKGGEVSP